MDENDKVLEKEKEVCREIEEQIKVDDPEVVKRRIKRDQKSNAWLLRTITKQASNDIVNELVREIPGRAVARNILDEILEMI
jgi:hypothetical protein